MYGGWPSDNEHGDTYGPVNYEAYVPFEQAFGIVEGFMDGAELRLCREEFAVRASRDRLGLLRRLRARRDVILQPADLGRELAQLREIGSVAIV